MWEIGKNVIKKGTYIWQVMNTWKPTDSEALIFSLKKLNELWKFKENGLSRITFFIKPKLKGNIHLI